MGEAEADGGEEEGAAHSYPTRSEREVGWKKKEGKGVQWEKGFT